MNLSDYFKYSVFANLSYIKWGEKASIGTQSDPRPRIRGAVEGFRVPEDLATQIFRDDQWYIPTTNGFVPNDPSGFAANVFVKDNSNEKNLAIRGTETDTSLFPIDLLSADLYEIPLYGLALHQAVSLINYVLLLKTPVGSTTNQFTLRVEAFLGSQPPDARFITSRFNQFNIWLEPTTRKDGLGVLSASDTITVTGHSLGGHLAALALLLCPGLFGQGVTFNAAGFDNFISDKLTDEFVELFAKMLPQENPAPNFTSLQSKLFTVDSEAARPGDDFDFVPGWWTGADPAFPDPTLVRTEANSHSMDQLQDNLAIHSLIERLGVSLSVETVFSLYDAASANGDRSSEVLVSADGDPAGPLRSTLRRASRIAGDLNQHLFDTIYHATALETPDAVLVTADIRYLKAASALGGFTSLAEWAR